jgi:hypothetical protein
LGITKIRVFSFWLFLNYPMTLLHLLRKVLTACGLQLLSPPIHFAESIHQPAVEYFRLRPTESISAYEPQGGEHSREWRTFVLSLDGPGTIASSGFSTQN